VLLAIREDLLLDIGMHQRIRRLKRLNGRDAYLIVDWVQFWLASGESERATHWARELLQQTRVHSPFAREREDVAHARIVLAQKRPMEALALLEPLEAGAEKQERWSHVIEIQESATQARTDTLFGHGACRVSPGWHHT
jgi:outer membrane PBP1 activator LpoA protein